MPFPEPSRCHNRHPPNSLPEWYRSSALVISRPPESVIFTAEDGDKHFSTLAEAGAWLRRAGILDEGK
jgi:hypothetical protein